MSLPYIPSAKTSEAILEFSKQSINLSNSQWNLRQRFEEIDRQYQRETDLTEDQWKSKQANMRGDANKYQNITMPIVMPQVETAVTYQQSVFLTGYPIFGAVSSPAFADAATQMDTIIGEQQVHANWVPEFVKSLRNGFKYNLGPTEVAWARKASFALETPGESANESPDTATDKQKEIIWEGNTVKALNPYNTFWDTRVDPIDVPAKAEFAGYVELMSRIGFKQFLSELPTRTNTKEALESGFAGTPANVEGSVGNYYVPQINPDAWFEWNKYSSTDWMSWAGINNSEPRIKYKNQYEVTTLYGRILPEDFGMTNVPARATPQVWKFIIVNGQVVVYAERLTNVHNLLPIFFCCPLDDGLGYQTKPFAKNLEPFQQVTSALSNSFIAARRRAIGDRMLYDPSRVAASSVRSDSPVARIPVRPSAYGTPMHEAVYPIPFRDDQSQYTMQAMQTYAGLADQVSGFNQTRRGQFVKGNKTRFEFEETMANANGRDHTIALMLEGTFFHPIKQVIKANILQYQGGVELFNREEGTSVEIDPLMLRRAQLEFKVSDGLLPSDKLIDGESMALAMQTMAQVPQLATGYNITQMFSYLMKSRGAKLQPFEKSQPQLEYENALAVWQQTVAAIAEHIGSRAESIEPEEFQRMLPPQPTPEQFGWEPGQPPTDVTNDGHTVMGRYTAVAQQMQQAQQQAGGEAGGASEGEQQ